MRLYLIIFIIVTISGKEDPTDYCDNINEVNIKSECQTVDLFIKNDTYRCCYVEIKDGNNNLKSCQEINMEEYINFSTFYDKYAKTLELTGLSLSSFDCSSFYLFISIIYILVLLF